MFLDRFRFLVQGSLFAGLCYGAYKGISYASVVLKKRREARHAPNPIPLSTMFPPKEEVKDYNIHKSDHEPLEIKELKEFIDAYSNNQEKKNGVDELLANFKVILSNVENGTGTKTINAANRNFQEIIMKNEIADRMLTSLSFEKKSDAYEYVASNGELLKIAIEYLERFE